MRSVHPSPAAAVTIRHIALAELSAQAGELLKAHWREIAREKDLMVLDPDWSRYEQLEAAGLLLSLGAFDGEQMVGYSVGLVHPHPHYRGLVYYQNDVLFVSPEARHSRLGIRLIQDTEAAAEAMGARWHAWHAKKGSKLDFLLERKGYAVHDIIYARRAKGD